MKAFLLTPKLNSNILHKLSCFEAQLQPREKQVMAGAPCHETLCQLDFQPGSVVYSVVKFCFIVIFSKQNQSSKKMTAHLIV